MTVRPRTHRRRKVWNRKSMERGGYFVLLILAWSWIFGFFGLVIWQGQKREQPVETTEKIEPAQKIEPAFSTTEETTPKEINRDGVLRPFANVVKPVTQLANPVVTKSSLLSKLKKDSYSSPLLIFTCERANYLSETLSDILNNIQRPCHFGCPIIVSEDGNHPDILQVTQSYMEKFDALGIPLIHIQHQPPKFSLRKKWDHDFAYQALAQHYGWALSTLFHGKVDPSLPKAQRVIILEEDIHTSPDFLSYMEATSKLLDEDETLLAVSAYNDNGHKVKDPKRLLRSDFFPGLGWMLTRKVWDEFESNWPAGYWDDWIREPNQRKGRQVIRPEISRTYHFGKKGGASANQFGSILEQVKLNKDRVDWSKEDLSYLKPTLYDKNYGNLIRSSRKVSSLPEVFEKVVTENVRLEYRSLEKFQLLARKLDIMDDEKATIPRTAYKGVIEVRPNSEYFLFLTPPEAELQKSFPDVDFSAG